MSEERGARGARKQAGRGFWWTLVLLVSVLGAVTAFLGWYLSRGPGETSGVLPGEAGPASDWTGSRGAVLYLAASRGAGTMTVDLALPARDRPADEIRDVLVELCEVDLPLGAARAIPEGTAVRGVFLDADAGHVVVDFTSSLVAGHPGGTAAEMATLRSVLRTIAFNFPELRTCSLLVDGALVATLAGHVRTDAPFVLGRWR